MAASVAGDGAVEAQVQALTAEAWSNSKRLNDILRAMAVSWAGPEMPLMSDETRRRVRAVLLSMPSPSKLIGEADLRVPCSEPRNP
jgi:hypothetical protein